MEVTRRSLNSNEQPVATATMFLVIFLGSDLTSASAPSPHVCPTHPLRGLRVQTGRASSWAAVDWGGGRKEGRMTSRPVMTQDSRLLCDTLSL